MPDRTCIQINKKITSPLIIKELEMMHQETGQEYLTIVYNCLVEKVETRMRLRESKERSLDDLSVNALRTQINEILDTFERYRKPMR